MSDRVGFTVLDLVVIGAVGAALGMLLAALTGLGPQLRTDLSFPPADVSRETSEDDT